MTYRTNYAVAIKWLHNNYVMCNNLPNIDNTIWDSIAGLADEDGEPEIYQYYVTDANSSDVEFLIEHFPGLLFAYSELLECWVLLVDHYGTAWSYVPWETDLEPAKAELGAR